MENAPPGCPGCRAADGTLLRGRGMACVAKLPLNTECAGDDDCVSGY
jgi:hypothetical protein